jgi:hypothetical protein
MTDKMEIEESLKKAQIRKKRIFKFKKSSMMKLICFYCRSVMTKIGCHGWCDYCGYQFGCSD